MIDVHANRTGGAVDTSGHFHMKVDDHANRHRQMGHDARVVDLLSFN
jgi:hypothetical protein